MLSLRRRLLFGTALGTAGVLCVAGFALYTMMRASLYAGFDGSLRQKAETLADLIEQEHDGIELEFAEADMAEFKRSDRPEYFQVWLADGTLVQRSPSLKGRDLPRRRAPLNEPEIRAAALPDGQPGRIATLHFSARPDGEHDAPAKPERLIMALARDTRDVESALAELRFALVLVGAVATLASVGVLAWLVQIGLRPVNALATRIGGIDEDRLSERIDPADSPQELQSLVHRLNDLLTRLDSAFAREKTLTADVAHELRTPLAGLRATLEVTLSRERDPAPYRKAMSECLEICTQTQSLIENLLALARLDAGCEAIQRNPTPIAKLLQETWKPFQKAAGDRKLDVRWDVAPGLTAQTEPDRLRLVLSNLFQNAVHYVDHGGEVKVEAMQANGTLRIRVSNTGSRISPEEIASVFDRFWRGDGAREHDGVHCGLGLSLCKTTMQHLGGTIGAATENGSFQVTISLPTNAGPD